MWRTISADRGRNIFARVKPFGYRQLGEALPRILLLEAGLRVILLSILPFLPLYFADDPRFANFTISVFLVVGIGGGIVLGVLADLVPEAYVITGTLLLLLGALAHLAGLPPNAFGLRSVGLGMLTTVPCGMACLALPYRWSPWLGMICYSFGEVSIFPALNYLGERYTSYQHKGRLFGLLGLALLGLVAGPLWSWLVQGLIGYQGLFVLGSILLAVSVLLLWFEERRFRMPLEGGGA